VKAIDSNTPKLTVRVSEETIQKYLHPLKPTHTIEVREADTQNVTLTIDVMEEQVQKHIVPLVTLI